MRALTLTCLVTLALCGGSCVESATQRSDDLLVANAEGAAPHELLAQFAAREKNARGLEPIAAPLPPGVDAAALTPRDAHDPRATLSLAKTERQLAEEFAAEQAEAGRPDWLEHPALDPDKAEAHYVRGRDAVARQAYDEAMRELLLAHNFDAHSPTIARELARVYVAVRNSSAAAAMYQHVLALEPNDPEAVLALALHAQDRRDFERAGGLIAALRQSGAGFDFDPAGEALASVCMVNVLDALEYDRAVAEAGEQALELIEAPPAAGLYTTKFGTIYRQRGELWRRVGDAHARLGDLAEALAAYERSAALPQPDAWSLLPRRVYALLQLGRSYGAQHLLYTHLAERAADDVDVRDVNLCAYVAQHVPDRAMLAEAVLLLHRAHPGEPGLVRCAAALVERGRAIDVLHAFVNEHAGDFSVLQQFLDWLAAQDLEAAADLVCTITERHPHRLEPYSAALLRAAPDPTKLLETLERGEPTPARWCVLAVVQQHLGAIGPAWTVVQDAVRRWPDSAEAARLAVLLAAELEEPALLEEALAQAEQFDDVITWTVRSQAHRAMNDLGEAQLAAVIAVEREPENVEALLELARVHTAIALAQPVAEDARLHAWDAVQAAENILASQPGEERAYEILFFIFGSEGPLTNTDSIEEHTAELASANPSSTLLRRLSLETALRQSRFDRGVELALELFDRAPTESGMLSYAVSAWAAMDDLDAANAWFERERALRPHDPVLLEHWARVKLQRSESAEAEQELTRLLAESPRNFRAMQLLEAVYRATGDLDRALELGEARLNARPEGVQRELALASMFAEAGHDERAVQHLTWITSSGSSASLEQLSAAIQLSESLEVEGALRDDLARTLIDRIVLAHPEVSMATYLSALHVLRNLQPVDESRLNAIIDCLLQRAAQDPASGDFAALLWREFAQQLVDLSRPDAATTMLRARLNSPHALEPEAATLLALCTVIADAAGGGTPEQSIDLLTKTFTDPAFNLLEALPAELSLADLVFEAANVYTLVGHDAGAEALHLKCIELESRHAMAMNNLGYQRIEAGRGDVETVQMIERAIQLEPDDANVLDTMGWLRYKQSRFDDQVEDPAADEANVNAADPAAAPQPDRPRLMVLKPGAISLLREAIQKSRRPSAEAHDHLGDALWRSGNKDGALREWKLAQSILSSEETKREMLAQYTLIQRNVWRLQVIAPEAIWDREFKGMLERLERKINAAELGGEPEVAPLFAEIDQPEGDR